MRFLSVFFLQLTVMQFSFAGRPFVTDDATIVDDCQLESWWQREDADNALWVMPACNVAGVELGLGAAKTAKGNDNLYVLAAKTELKTLQTNGYGITVGAEYEFPAQNTKHGDIHVNFAFSKSWLDDQFIVHANAGRIMRDEAHDDWTSGIAVQWEAAENQWLFAELYREEAGRPSYQLGYLTEVLPERLQLDISYGNHLHEKGGEDFFSVGAVFYFKVF